MTDVKEFLSSVQEAKFAFLRCKLQVEELQQRCESITTSWSADPHGNGEVHKDGPLIALAEKRTEMKKLYHKWEQTEEEVDRFLDGIDGLVSRAILKYRFVDLLTMTRTADELEKAGLPYTFRHLFRLQDKAVEEARELWRKKCEEDEANERK